MKSLKMTFVVVVMLVLFVQVGKSQWTSIGLSSDRIMSLAVKSNGHIFAGTYSNGLYRSTDDGANWTQVLGPSSVYEVYSIAFDGSGNVYAGTYAAGLYRSTNDGDNWTLLSSSTGPNNLPVGDVYAVGVTTGGTLIAVEGASNNGWVYRSTDGGSTWAYNLAPSAGMTCMAVGQSDFVCVGGGAWYDHSTNAGANWTSEGSSSGLKAAPYALAISPSGKVYAGTSGSGVFHSTDNGVSWSIDTVRLKNKYVLTVAVNSLNQVFAGTDGGGAFFLTDTGWVQANTGLGDTKVLSLAFDLSGNVLAGTNAHGVYRTAPGDVGLPVEMASYQARLEKNSVVLTWKTATEINNVGFNILRRDQADFSVIASYTDIPSLRSPGTSIAGGRYAYTDATVSRGETYEYMIEEVSSDGRTKRYGPINVTASGIPSQLRLSQNYPNPFNPSTTIRYELPAAGFVTLKVFDMLGREIRTLVNEQQGIGTQTVRFDAGDLSGGVYFAVLRTRGGRLTTKLLLVK